MSRAPDHPLQPIARGGLGSRTINPFLVKYGSVLFIAIAIGSFAGLILFETPFNAPFLWAFRYLTVPITAAILGYTFLNRRELIALTNSRWKVYVSAFVLCPLLVLFAGGWVSLVNGLCGDGSVIRYEGAVQRKFETHGRNHGWCVEIFDEASRAPVVFDVSRSDYAAHQVGDRHSRVMQKGGLGIPYEPRTRSRPASPALE
jgi:hypothetical protein